jgi:hypothetical protein
MMTSAKVQPADATTTSSDASKGKPVKVSPYDPEVKPRVALKLENAQLMEVRDGLRTRFTSAFVELNERVKLNGGNVATIVSPSVDLSGLGEPHMDQLMVVLESVIKTIALGLGVSVVEGLNIAVILKEIAHKGAYLLYRDAIDVLRQVIQSFGLEAHIKEPKESEYEPMFGPIQTPQLAEKYLMRLAAWIESFGPYRTQILQRAFSLYPGVALRFSGGAYPDPNTSTNFKTLARMAKLPRRPDSLSDFAQLMHARAEELAKDKLATESSTTFISNENAIEQFDALIKFLSSKNSPQKIEEALHLMYEMMQREILDRLCRVVSKRDERAFQSHERDVLNQVAQYYGVANPNAPTISVEEISSFIRKRAESVQESAAQRAYEARIIELFQRKDYMPKSDEEWYEWTSQKARMSATSSTYNPQQGAQKLRLDLESSCEELERQVLALEKELQQKKRI